MTELFGLAWEVVLYPVSGTPLIVPCGRRHARSPAVEERAVLADRA